MFHIYFIIKIYMKSNSLSSLIKTLIKKELFYSSDRIFLGTNVLVWEPLVKFTSISWQYNILACERIHSARPISQRHIHRLLSSRFSHPVPGGSKGRGGKKSGRGRGGGENPDLGEAESRFALRARARGLLWEPQGRRNASPAPNAVEGKNPARPTGNVFYFFSSSPGFFFDHACTDENNCVGRDDVHHVRVPRTPPNQTLADNY